VATGIKKRFHIQEKKRVYENTTIPLSRSSILDTVKRELIFNVFIYVYFPLFFFLSLSASLTLRIFLCLFHDFHGPVQDPAVNKNYTRRKKQNYKDSFLVLTYTRIGRRICILDRDAAVSCTYSQIKEARLSLFKVFLFYSAEPNQIFLQKLCNMHIIFSFLIIMCNIQCNHCKPFTKYILINLMLNLHIDMIFNI